MHYEVEGVREDRMMGLFHATVLVEGCGTQGRRLYFKASFYAGKDRHGWWGVSDVDSLTLVAVETYDGEEVGFSPDDAGLVLEAKAYVNKHTEGLAKALERARV